MNLVGFITRICHDARSPECQINRNSPGLLQRVESWIYRKILDTCAASFCRV